MLHYHYTSDTDRYENERQRVQQAFLMIIHASSGVRPSSTIGNRTAQRQSPNHENTTLKSGGEDENKKIVVDEDEDKDDKEDAEKDSKCFKLRYRDLVLSALPTKNGVRYIVRPKFRYFKEQTRRAQKYAKNC